MLAGGFRAVQWAFALAAIEACKMPARQRGPEHAVAIDVAAARREAGADLVVEWRFVDFGERRLRRIRSRHQPHDFARIAKHCAPDRSVRRSEERRVGKEWRDRWWADDEDRVMR